MAEAGAQAIDLGGRKVLVAEPNPLIAFDLVATLSAWGAVPVVLDEAFTGSLEEAIAGVDLALVDVAVPPRRNAELVELLLLRGIPAVLTSTSQPRSVEAHYPGTAILEKPVDYALLAEWLVSDKQDRG